MKECSNCHGDGMIYVESGNRDFDATEWDTEVICAFCEGVGEFAETDSEALNLVYSRIKKLEHKVRQLERRMEIEQ